MLVQDLAALFLHVVLPFQLALDSTAKLVVIHLPKNHDEADLLLIHYQLHSC